MNWELAIKRVADQVVKIETPSSYGTGFLAFYNIDKTACGVATAAHVVSHADEWREPIRIRTGDDKVLFLPPEQRYMFVDNNSDSAVIFFFKDVLEFPEVPVALRPSDLPCSIGNEIGWVGYPTIDRNTLCFFSGTISARKEDDRTYNIDGVAIHGVSGGPVFHLPTPDPKDLQIIGAISAYYPNMQSGQPWPGLAQARDVSHFVAVASHIKSMDDANDAKIKFDKEIAAQAGTAPTSASSGPIGSAPIGSGPIGGG